MNSFPPTVFIIEQWLRRKGFSAVGLYSHMKPNERNGLVDSFNSGEPFQNNPSPDIIIGTPQLLGTEYTCVRARYLIILRP
ncbi:hypothetical protein EMCG_02905 [[Emmonsia] crescens]|uniref:Helicase C-terminal domain-containing protein n=1 Tax=[Emmonsia] crescens TaxID=73230 RepID=A0A0G2HX89_9EURO|nr:hypothetical protein EMCG_02905 [Emmonsia crescens UAMH 3008]